MTAIFEGVREPCACGHAFLAHEQLPPGRALLAGDAAAFDCTVCGCRAYVQATFERVHERLLARLDAHAHTRVEQGSEEAEAEAEFSRVYADLGAQERLVLLVLAKRLLAGQSTYGVLSLATDARDWRQQRAQELADALIYGAISEVATMMKKDGNL
jgi:transposase